MFRTPAIAVASMIALIACAQTPASQTAPSVSAENTATSWLASDVWWRTWCDPTNVPSDGYVFTYELEGFNAYWFDGCDVAYTMEWPKRITVLRQDADGVYGIVGSEIVAYDRSGREVARGSASVTTGLFASHHDVLRLGNGNFLAITLEVRQGYRVDYVQEVDLDAQRVVWTWNANEELLGSDEAARDIGVRGESWIHANSLDVFPNGDVLLSARNLNALVRIDRDTGDIVWSRGYDTLSLQHHATIEPDGGILVYNNGDDVKQTSIVLFRPDGSLQNEWMLPWYANSFGSVERLSDGKWLVTDGTTGRVFLYLPDFSYRSLELQLARKNFIPWAEVSGDPLRRFIYRAHWVPALPIE